QTRNRLRHSGHYSGHRRSGLAKIHTANVKRRTVAWVHHAGGTGAHETTPLMVDGVIFLSEGPNVVKALDTRTGNELWRYEKKIPEDLRLCCGRPNRGVAILGDTIYYGSIDAHLIALDAKTGD